MSVGAPGLPLVDFFSLWRRLGEGTWSMGSVGRLTGKQYKNLERLGDCGWFSGTQEGTMHLTLLTLL